MAPLTMAELNRLQRLRSKALELMREHGITRKGWVLVWNQSVDTLGETHWSNKTIYLSERYARANSDHEVRDTVLHEIAHVLAGPRAGHGKKWQEIAKRIGANGKAKFTPTKFQEFTPYVGFCPVGHGIQAHRISWESTGKPCKCGKRRKWMTTKRFLKKYGLDTVLQWY